MEKKNFVRYFSDFMRILADFAYYIFYLLQPYYYEAVKRARTVIDSDKHLVINCRRRYDYSLRSCVC